MNTIEKPDEGIDIIHAKHGHARCRRDQLAEFRECGWKPASEANAEEVKAAAAANTKATAEAKKDRAVVDANREAVKAKADAPKKK